MANALPRSGEPAAHGNVILNATVLSIISLHQLHGLSIFIPTGPLDGRRNQRVSNVTTRQLTPVTMRVAARHLQHVGAVLTIGLAAPGVLSNDPDAEGELAARDTDWRPGSMAQ